MPNAAEKWPENAPGKFFVDGECIDCDLCRSTAPENFARSALGGYSFVSVQPRTPQELAACEQAQGYCPVDAIGDE